MTIKLSEEAKQDARFRIPEHMVDHVIGYFERGIPPGQFLRAVLENDLVSAVTYADDINKYKIHEYVQWLYWYAPGRPYGWGSREAVDTWVRESYEDNKAIAND